jgi:hypothetical protein
MVNFLGTTEGTVSTETTELYNVGASARQGAGQLYDRAEHRGSAVRKSLFSRFFVVVKARKHPTAGAMDHALITNLLAQHPLIGPAIGQVQTLRWTVPQNVQGTGQVAITGIGGLAHGQIVLQPLSDPYEGV